LFNVLAMVAQFESDLIRLRTTEGMRVAKAKGRLRGKQPKLNPRQEAHLVALYRAAEHSTTTTCLASRDPWSTGPSNAPPDNNAPDHKQISPRRDPWPGRRRASSRRPVDERVLSAASCRFGRRLTAPWSIRAETTWRRGVRAAPGVVPRAVPP
jgi:Resolvase, N terminal domain